MPQKSDTIEFKTYLKEPDGERLLDRARKEKMTIAEYLRRLIAQDLERDGEPIQPLEHGGRRAKVS